MRIPASVMDAMHLHLDEVVEVREEKGRIVIEPIRQKALALLNARKQVKYEAINPTINASTTTTSSLTTGIGLTLKTAAKPENRTRAPPFKVNPLLSACSANLVDAA